jgi:murein DD-endopeptidase MepM/ murein hydrolase activator NlpD
VKDGYLVKIIPPKGYRVHRVEFTRTHVALVLVLALATVAAIATYWTRTVFRAEARVHELRSVTDSQQAALSRMNQQAEAIGDELRRLRVQNQQIRRLMGADRDVQPRRAGAQPDGPQSFHPSGFDQVADRLRTLESDSRTAKRDADGLRRLVMRVLNVHRIEDLARARLLAGIPSINPVPGTGIASAFGWRILPWPSYHQGVDLDADYGAVVHAAAAGTVAFAGWDGGYGLKVDIDHHNGYHTWYAHLSRVDVRAGDYVRKAQAIALVGATGDATGPHLHYQMTLAGHIVDPTPYLGGVPDRVLASLK